jgi:hypothetical protein
MNRFWDNVTDRWGDFWGYAVGKPKSLNSIHLSKGWEIDRWARAKDGCWEGTIAREGLVIKYDQGMEDAWFWDKGNLHGSTDNLEDYHEEVWNLQKVRLGRWKSSDGGKWYYQVTFSEVPITFGSWVENPAQEREIRSLLASYKGRTEYMTWMPDRLVDALGWLLENPLTRWVSKGNFFQKYLKRKALLLGIVALVLGPIFIAVWLEDLRPVPGKEAFKKVDGMIRGSSEGEAATGESEDDRVRAQLFAERIQPHYERAIDGKVSFWAEVAGKRCFVYSRAGKDDVLFLCKMPGLDEKSIFELREEAWRIAEDVCRQTGVDAEKRLLLGLKNLVYEVIMERSLDGTLVVHKDHWLEPKLYPFFDSEVKSLSE